MRKPTPMDTDGMDEAACAWLLDFWELVCNPSNVKPNCSLASVKPRDLVCMSCVACCYLVGVQRAFHPAIVMFSVCLLSHVPLVMVTALKSMTPSGP